MKQESMQRVSQATGPLTPRSRDELALLGWNSVKNPDLAEKMSYKVAVIFGRQELQKRNRPVQQKSVDLDVNEHNARHNEAEKEREEKGIIDKIPKVHKLRRMTNKMQATPLLVLERSTELEVAMSAKRKITFEE